MAGETQREWGCPIKKIHVVAHIDAIWDELAIFNNGKSADARLFCPIYRSDRESA
ncbi:hypothetical protein ACVXHB_21100 [Escherichia coli]